MALAALFSQILVLKVQLPIGALIFECVNVGESWRQPSFARCTPILCFVLSQVRNFVFLLVPHVDATPISCNFGEFIFWSSCSSQSNVGFLLAWLDLVIGVCAWGQNLEYCLAIYVMSVDVVLFPSIFAKAF